MSTETNHSEDQGGTSNDENTEGLSHETFKLSTHLIKNQATETDEHVEHIEHAEVLEEIKQKSIIDLALSRKAYMALAHYTHTAEMSHIIEAAHHTGSDQRHHLKVPMHLSEVARHAIDATVRQVVKANKIGKTDYGNITIKNLRHASTMLHATI